MVQMIFERGGERTVFAVTGHVKGLFLDDVSGNTIIPDEVCGESDIDISRLLAHVSYLQVDI